MANAGKDLKAIRLLVGMQARKRGYQCENLTPDTLAVTAPSGQRQNVSLVALQQAASALPSSEWMAAVDEFLERALNAPATGDEELDTIAPLLRTKLVPEDLAQQGSIVCDDFGQDLFEGLVIDRALVMEWVTRDRASGWSAKEHELLRRGRENVRAAGRLDVDTIEVDGVPVSVLYGDDYASTHLYWLDEYDLVGEHGTLVSVPTRTTVLATPIVAGTTGFHYLNAMVLATMKMYEDAEHPLMPRVYHWDPAAMEAMDQVLGAALLRRDHDGRLAVIVNPAFQESQETLGR